MGSIRGRIRESTEDVDVRAQRLLLSSAEEVEIDPEFLSRLFAPGESWNLLPDYPIETHRPGLEGHLVVFLKRLVRPLVRLYSDVLFREQMQINLYLVRTCQALAREVVRLEDSLARRPKG